MKVKSTLECYEVNGTEPKNAERETIEVHSHWNMNDRVVLEIDGKRYTVLAQELVRAIANAQNHRG